VKQVLTAHIHELLIDPHEVPFSWAEWRQPLAFVDLDTCSRDVRLAALPPFPLIGLGDPAHPLASALDAIVEAPVSAEGLMGVVARTPHAAAVAVQLLRSLEGVSSDRALTLESLSYGLLQGSAEHERWLAERVPVPQHSAPGRLIVERLGAELYITIDRPLARNAIGRSLRDQLFEAFSLAAVDAEIRAVKLQAAGPAFSVGGDLDEFGTIRDPATAHLIRSRTLPALAICSRAEILDVHVQGACIGAGLEIAAFAGRISATPDAWFQLPELSMGLIPGAGGCVSVPRRIGRQRAALMILSGRRISAATALGWGLIDSIEEAGRSGARE